MVKDETDRLQREEAVGEGAGEAEGEIERGGE